MIKMPEFGELHSILMTIVENELTVPVPVPEIAHVLLAEQQRDAERVPDRGLSWLALLNLAISPHLFRTYFKSHVVQENTIRVLLRFLVAKKPHSQSDRDKVDWLLTYLFKAREEKTGEPLGWPKSEVQEILQDFDFPRLSGAADELLVELLSLLEDVKYVNNFSQIAESRIIQKGRDLKSRFGEEFFHPDVLTPVVNYNLISGKKVHALLEQTIQHVQEFTHSQPEPEITNTRELLHSDYRANAEGFHHLAELTKKQASARTNPAVTDASSRAGDDATSLEYEDQASLILQWQDFLDHLRMQKLGINEVQEMINLKNRDHEISGLLKATPSIHSLPGAWEPLSLQVWEANAFRVDYAESEESFRSEYAGGIRRAIVILSRIEEELPLYIQKKGSSSEHEVKKLHDKLCYLLQEGSEHWKYLIRLSAISERKGASLRARQIGRTAEKLEANLAKVVTILSPSSL